jgi:WD40 repeat protein
LQGHKDWIFSLAFSPKGDQLISGSRDKTLRLWQVSASMGLTALGSSLRAHDGVVFSVAFSPTGDKLISGSYDGILRLWQVNASGLTSLSKPLQAHRGGVTSVAFLLTGDKLVSGGHDNMLYLWQVDHAGAIRLGRSLQGHKDEITSVAVSPRGDKLVSGSKDKTLLLWQVEANEITILGRPLQGHLSMVKSVAFSPTGDRIVSGGASSSYGAKDYSVRLWQITEASGEAIALGSALQGHKNDVTSVIFSSAGDQLISGSRDKTLRLWDISNVEQMSCLQVICWAAPIWTVAFRKLLNISTESKPGEGAFLAMGDEHGCVSFWHLGQGRAKVALEFVGMPPQSGCTKNIWRWLWRAVKLKGAKMHAQTHQLLAQYRAQKAETLAVKLVTAPSPQGSDAFSDTIMTVSHTNSWKAQGENKPLAVVHRSL